jgi:mRNA-degrading endonuclease RelE of RelBE toxin-antitoxin system
MNSTNQNKIECGLSPGERKMIDSIVDRVAENDFEGMVLEKLKQRNDIFRVRNGDMRLLYRNDIGTISLLALERRRNN